MQRFGLDVLDRRISKRGRVWLGVFYHFTRSQTLDAPDFGAALKRAQRWYPNARISITSLGEVK